MKKFDNQKGALSFGSILFIAFIGIAIFVGVKLLVPVVRFYQVEALFKDKVVRLKVAKEEEVRAEVDKQLVELGVTFPEDGYRVIQEDGKPAVIEGEYKVVVDFAGVYQYKLDFKPRGEAPH